MFQGPIHAPADDPLRGTPALLDLLARVSTRPRYAFMLLGLIAEVADPSGKAGPFVRAGMAPGGGQAQGPAGLKGACSLRDWLCDALMPMGGRDPRRAALIERVRADLARERRLPADLEAAERLVEEEARERIRASGKTNLSRAVSELVRAGLLRRHYQGYRVDHQNRGAQRLAVYTLMGPAKCLIRKDNRPETRSGRRQLELGLN